MKKILHFELTKNHGGIESFLLNLTKSLNKDDEIQFEFVTEEKEELSYEKTIKQYGGIIHRISSKKNFIKYCLELNTLLKSKTYSAAHFHKNSLINIIPIVIAKINKVPVVIVHSHNTSSTEGARILKFLHYLNRYIVNYIDIKRVACSELAKKWMFGNNNNVVMIPNGIDVKKYKFNFDVRKKMRTELGIDDGNVLLGTVGRLTEQKNHVFLLNIMKKIDRKYILVIIGQGELEQQLKNKINEMGLSDRVKLLGERSDIPDVLQAFDIFLMPSKYEGLPIAGVEAQASGLPMVVSTNVSSELNILGHLNFVDLVDSKWIDVINQISIARLSNVGETFLRKGYDIRSTKKRVVDLY